MNQYNDVLFDLQDYMLYEDNMVKSLKNIIEPKSNDNILEDKNNKINKNNTTNKYTNNIKQNLFIPNQQDSLFWCFYIIKNGNLNYEMLNNKNTLLAKQIKIDMVDIIRKNKDIIKQYKFDTISNHESNLANDNNLNIRTFFTLCAIENINVIYLKKNTYYELLMNDSNVIYILHELESKSKYFNKYGFELSTENVLNNIQNNFFKLESLIKPIKSISAYKLNELIDISNKLVIKINNDITSKQKSKKELYESIIQYF